MNRTAASLVALLLLLPAPAPADDEGAASPAPDESPEEAAAPDPGEALAAEMSALVERIRGLKFKAPVDRTVKDRDEVRREFLPGEDGEGKGRGKRTSRRPSRVLSFLGLLEERKDPGEAQARFMADSAAGYYDPGRKVFTVVSGAPTSLNRMVVFHELVHAVEDQHYDMSLREGEYRRAGLSDHFHAWRAVVEGSAQLHTDRYLDSEEGLRSRVAREAIGGAFGAGGTAARKGAAGGDGKGAAEADGKPGTPSPPPRPRGPGTPFGDTPAYLVIRNGMFYYFNGARFLRAVFEARGEAGEGVDPLAPVYADPPLSTEMILHPEKYTGPRDLPRAVNLPDVAPLLGEGWEPAGGETVGELGMGMALNRWRFSPATPMQVMMVLKVPDGGFRKPEDFLDTPLAFSGDTARAVEGWDGDRLAVFARGDEVCGVWVSVWDSAEDAAEFADLYVRLLPRKYRGAVEGEGAPATAVAAEGDRVIVAERIPAGSLEGVMEALRGAEVVRDPADALPAE